MQGHPHIDDVAARKINFSWRSCTFNNHHIVFSNQFVKCFCDVWPNMVASFAPGHLGERLIDLANNKLGNSPAAKPISDLAAGQLAELRDRLTAGAAQGNIDAYTKAHFRENAARITKLLEARYTVTP